MVQNKKPFSLEGGFVLVVVLINILIIKTAYTITEDLYWLLLLSIPVLVLAIYLKRSSSNKVTNGKIIDFNCDKFYKVESILPPRIKCDELNVTFGNSSCSQPYISSIICFESVSADENIKSILKQIALSKDNYYTEDMLESLNDSLSKSDCIWKVGPDYSGCKDYNNKFCAESFKVNALRPNVKMIELALTGVNDKANISEREKLYIKPINGRSYSGSEVAHTAFRNAESMTIFLDSLRNLSGKKPVGISLSITDKTEFYKMCYTFRKTHIIPDFVVVEGYTKENIKLNNISADSGMRLYEALEFVSKTLETYGLSKEIKIIAASEIYTAFDVLKLRALGADAISMRNSPVFVERPYQKEGIDSTSFASLSKDRFRSQILNSTMSVIQGWGYINIKDITISSFIRNLDTLHSIDNYPEHNQEILNVSDNKSYRIPNKGIYEKDTSSGVLLN